MCVTACVQKESQKHQGSAARSWIHFRWVEESPSQTPCFPRTCPPPPCVAARVPGCQPSAEKVGLVTGSGDPWGALASGKEISSPS